MTIKFVFGIADWAPLVMAPVIIIVVVGGWERQDLFLNGPTMKLP